MSCGLMFFVGSIWAKQSRISYFLFILRLALSEVRKDSHRKSDKHISSISNELLSRNVYISQIAGWQGECQKLLCVVNVLDNSDSANAATMHSVTKRQLERKQIPLSNLRGLANDGANVMVGTALKTQPTKRHRSTRPHTI